MYYWRKINIILFVALLLLLIPSVYPLLLPGFFVTDDGTWMVVRLSAFYDTLRDGQIPARLLERLNNGYGYPVANFLYPGFLYIGAALHIIGLSFVDSVKTIFAISMIFSGIFTYLWIRKIFDPYAAFIGSLFYVYTPYHLYDLYTRGSVGEVLAFVWIPFILWQIERKSLPLTAIGVFLLVVSHNSLAALSLPLILTYGLIQRNGFVTIAATLVGIAMSAFFIVPAIVELSYTRFSEVKISNPFEYFADIRLIGYSTFAVIVVFLIAVFSLRKSLIAIPKKGATILFFTLLLLSLFFSTQIGSILWNVVPSQFIQFPYRFLSLLLISVAFISAFTVSKTSGRFRILLIVCMTGILAFSATPFVSNLKFTSYPDEYYSTNMDTTTVKNEYMPKWVKKVPEKMPENKFETIEGGAIIENANYNSRRAELSLINSANSTIRFNHIYYPQWKAYMNNEKLNISYDNEFGVMDIKIVRNSGKLTLVFEETPLRFISNFVTIIATLFVMFLLSRPVLKFR